MFRHLRSLSMCMEFPSRPLSAPFGAVPQTSATVLVGSIIGPKALPESISILSIYTVAIAHAANAWPQIAPCPDYGNLGMPTKVLRPVSTHSQTRVTPRPGACLRPSSTTQKETLLSARTTVTARGLRNNTQPLARFVLQAIRPPERRQPLPAAPRARARARPGLLLLAGRRRRSGRFGRRRRR